MSGIRYFNNSRERTGTKLNPSLFWEYDLSKFDYQKMANVVVQRVIERGWPDDWYAMLNMYPLDQVKGVVKSLPYLNDKDMNFLSFIFQIPLSEMKCYTKKQSQPTHWNS